MDITTALLADTLMFPGTKPISKDDLNRGGLSILRKDKTPYILVDFYKKISQKGRLSHKLMSSGYGYRIQTQMGTATMIKLSSPDSQAPKEKDGGFITYYLPYIWMMEFEDLLLLTKRNNYEFKVEWDGEVFTVATKKGSDENWLSGKDKTIGLAFSSAVASAASREQKIKKDITQYSRFKTIAEIVQSSIGG